MNKTLRYIILFLGSACLFQGCSQSPHETEEALENSTDMSADRDEIDVIYGRLPEPGVIASRLEATGTDFDWSFLKIGDYPRPESDTSQAIISGMLTADVGYFILFDQADFETPYYNELNMLSGEMCNIPRDELEQLNIAFSANQNRRDSLIQILNTIYSRTTHSLEQGNEGHLAILYTVSNLTENMFITASLIDNYPKDLLAEDSRSIIIIPLVRTLLEQEPNLEDALLLLNRGMDENSFSTTLKNELEYLNRNYDLLNIAESLRNRRADLLMSDTTFQQLRQKIGKIRNILLEKAG
ncbi:MAG: hypothetical protein P8X57_13020 [Cyclobacteriaceae bacterium]